MDYVRSISSAITSDAGQQFMIKTAGCTVLAGACGYGGAFFFTDLNPITSFVYFGTIGLVSQVAYQALEKLKDSKESSIRNYTIQAIQLLQIPVYFHLFHGGAAGGLTGAVKLELITATAYFIATPIFLHLGIKAWNEPTNANIATAVGVMLPLANGMAKYAKIFG